MKEINDPEPKDNNNINNINNDEKVNTSEMYQHFIKDSTVALNNPNKIPEKKPLEEDFTVMTNVGFLNEELEKGKEIYELNKSLEKTEDTSQNNSRIINSTKEGKIPPKETFFQKTKRWAGVAWSYVNIANYFPKTEFKEYRNANGDMVKIPIKKIPLKKKINKDETDEEHIVNKTVDRYRSQLSYLTADRIPFPNFY